MPSWRSGRSSVCPPSPRTPARPTTRSHGRLQNTQIQREPAHLGRSRSAEPADPEHQKEESIVSDEPTYARAFRPEQSTKKMASALYSRRSLLKAGGAGLLALGGGSLLSACQGGA